MPQQRSTSSGSTWRHWLGRIWNHVQEDDIFGRAAQLSYYFLLALFPLLLFLLTLLGYFAEAGSQLRAGLIRYLGTIMPPSALDLVHKTITEISSGKGGGKLSLGLLGALWAASNGMTAITDTLNVAYDVKETRPWWKTRLVSIGLTIVLAVIIILALATILLGSRIANWIAAGIGFADKFIMLWQLLQWPIVVGFLLLTFSLIYYLAPDLKTQRWRSVIPGSIVAVTLWILVSFAFRLYLQFFNTYSVTYGSLGALIVLMLWFYFTGVAILIGGEVNAALRRAHKASAL